MPRGSGLDMAATIDRTAPYASATRGPSPAGESAAPGSVVPTPLGPERAAKQVQHPHTEAAGIDFARVTQTAVDDDALPAVALADFAELASDQRTAPARAAIDQQDAVRTPPQPRVGGLGRCGTGCAQRLTRSEPGRVA